MTRIEFEAMLKTLADGWTAGDYDAVIACFDEKVSYSDPNNYSFADAGALLRFFRDDGVEQSCRFHDSLFDEERQIGAAEYTYRGTHRYHGTVWIDVKDDRIVRWREYQHQIGFKLGRVLVGPELENPSRGFSILFHYQLAIVD